MTRKRRSDVRIDLNHDTLHLCTRFRIDDMKAMSRGISGTKQVLKFADTSNRGQVWLSSQNDKAILNLQNVPFKYRQVSYHYCLL